MQRFPDDPDVKDRIASRPIAKLLAPRLTLTETLSRVSLLIARTAGTVPKLNSLTEILSMRPSNVAEGTIDKVTDPLASAATVLRSDAENDVEVPACMRFAAPRLIEIVPAVRFVMLKSMT